MLGDIRKLLVEAIDIIDRYGRDSAQLYAFLDTHRDPMLWEMVASISVMTEIEDKLTPRERD